VIVTGNMYDCAVGNDANGNRYNTVFLFNADRSRYSNANGDWSTPPIDTGVALSEDYNVIENNQPNPAVVDLDGDGKKEIVYPAFDGRLHAFWLDKTEHHNWPYSVVDGGEGIHRFTSEVAVADLDADGFAEIIFASWTQKGSSKLGHLHVLNYKGELLYKVDLPSSLGSENWNGSLAAPTLGNIDNDSDLEVVLNTAHAGIVAYDLPGTGSAKVYWSNGSGVDRVLQPPQLKVTQSGLHIGLDWGQAPSAAGYTLYYAPYPYTGLESIRQIDLGSASSIEFDLWNGFVFYVAIKSKMTSGTESIFSNVELIIDQ